MLEGIPGLQVVAHQAGIADRDRVAGCQAGQPVVDARELHRTVVQLPLGHRSGGEVDGPTPQHRAGIEAAVLAPQLRVAATLHDNAIAVFVGVGDVEDIAGLDLEPANLAERVIAAQYSEACAVVVVPAVGHIAFTVDRDIEVEHDRQIHEDHMLRRHREVVHHGERLDLYRSVDGQISVGVDTVVGHVWLKQVAVTEEMQFSGRRADLGVRGHRVLKFAAEVVAAHRLQVVGELVGK